MDLIAEINNQSILRTGDIVTVRETYLSYIKPGDKLMVSTVEDTYRCSCDNSSRRLCGENNDKLITFLILHPRKEGYEHTYSYSCKVEKDLEASNLWI